MIARCTPLFMVSTVETLGIDARQVVAIIGCSTALLAGIIALTQNDLKRVLAYSTISQLGYMFLGVGTGSLAGITAGMFHLFTHAFFKALLFLGAGSVMHAMGGVIDMRQFGGLRRLMPITFLTFLCGCLALSGVFPFAGFFSKDAVLAAVHERAHPPHAGEAQHAHEGDGPHHHTDASMTDGRLSFVPASLSDVGLYGLLYYAALVTAFLTAVYTFRAFFLTFMGHQRVPPEAGHHAHESPGMMTLPLGVLAACSVVVGFWHGGFVDFLSSTPSLANRTVQEIESAHAFHFDVAAVSLLVALAGIGVAAFFYLGDRAEVAFLGRIGEGLAKVKSGRAAADSLATAFLLWPARFFYNLSYRKFYLDEIYHLLIVAPLRLLAGASYFMDRRLIDGIVDACGRFPGSIGSWFRSLQSGLVQFYALAMVLGLIVLIGTVVMWQLT
jgi:NADH-quinone oxidoreductase subunit L